MPTGSATAASAANTMTTVMKSTGDLLVTLEPADSTLLDPALPATTLTRRPPPDLDASGPRLC